MDWDVTPKGPRKKADTTLKERLIWVPVCLVRIFACIGNYGSFLWWIVVDSIISIQSNISLLTYFVRLFRFNVIGCNDDGRINLLCLRTVAFLAHFDEAPQYIVLPVGPRWKLAISIWRTFSFYNCHHFLTIAQHRLGISMKRAA